MKSYRTNIIATFEDPHDANTAADALIDEGIQLEDISLISTKTIIEEYHSEDRGRHVGESAGSGAALGGIAGLIVGAISLTLPGLAPLVIAGPLAVALGVTGGTLAAGTLSGGAIGAALGALFGLTEEEADEYVQSVLEGNVILSVNASTRVDNNRVQQILKEHNGQEIHYHVNETEIE